MSDVAYNGRRVSSHEQPRTRLLVELHNGLSQIPAHELRVPVDPVQGARLFLRVAAYVDALSVDAHRFAFLKRQHDAGSFPTDFEGGVVEGFTQRDLHPRLRPR